MTKKINKIDKFQAYAVRNPVTVGSAFAMLLVGGCTMVSGFAPADAVTSPSMVEILPTKTNVTPAVVSTIKPEVKLVDLSYVNKVRLGGMAGAYFGKVRRDENGNVKQLPNKVEIDFVANLQGLWDKKLKIRNVTGATQKNADFIVNRYRTSDPDYKGIKTFIKEVDDQAFLAHKSIDFKALCDKMKLNGAQCVTLNQVTSNIRGEQLVAYGMTEVMPTWNGEVNYVMLDTLLRNAGENYIQSIPALGDKLMSLGFYQFTSHAVYHADTVEGASYVNMFVRNRKAMIPGSVVALEGADHHRAAFYFATYNMGRLMKKLNEKDTAMLASGICSTTSLTQFIATAHHMPSRAIDKAKDWIKGRCQKPITYYMGEHLTEYATKTKNNLEALEKHS